MTVVKEFELGPKCKAESFKCEQSEDFRKICITKRRKGEKLVAMSVGHGQ